MLDRYRLWFEHEIDSNAKMLGMVESVPPEARSDERFQQAVTLAAHLAACRENWLDRILTSGANQGEWWEPEAKLDGLRDRYASLEENWSNYLATLEDAELSNDFEFALLDGKRYRWSIEGQVVQLVGHAFYHRGQIALLVTQLGGQQVDTDYLYWAFPRNPNWGLISES